MSRHRSPPAGWVRERLASGGRFLRTFRWREVLPVRRLPWSNLRPWRALRVGTGVALPLLVGVSTGNLRDGAFCAIGALSAGFASFQGTVRQRAWAVLFSSAGMAVATFVGATTAAVPWLLVPAMGVVGLVVGAAVSLGPRLSAAAIQWPVAMLVADAVPLGSGQAGVRAALVFAGGCLQAVLVAGTWAVRPGRPESEAAADTFRQLARYARRIAGGHLEPPLPDSFVAMDVIRDPNPLLPPARRAELARLGSAADAIRASLAASASLGVSPDFARSVAAVLDGIVAVLDGSPGPDRLPVDRVPPGVPWGWAGHALRAELSRSLSAARQFGSLPRMSLGDAPTLRRGAGRGARLAVWAEALRDVAARRSEAGRHALRLGLAAAAAQAVAVAFQPAEEHWIPLTVFVVLRPDYLSTVSRGLQRTIGTLLGAGLGLAVVELGHLSSVSMAVAAALCAALAYALFEVSYALYSILLTGWVVVIIDILGVPAASAAPARALDTLLGAGIALVAFMLWPTWQSTTASQRISEAIVAHGAYAATLLRQLGREAPDLSALHELQTEAGSARVAADAATRLAAAQPGRRSEAPGRERVVAALADLAGAELSLHALLLAGSAAAPPRSAALLPLADDVERRMRAYAEASVAGDGPRNAFLPPVSAPPDLGGHAGALVDRLLRAVEATGLAATGSLGVTSRMR